MSYWNGQPSSAPLASHNQGPMHPQHNHAGQDYMYPYRPSHPYSTSSPTHNPVHRSRALSATVLFYYFSYDNTTLNISKLLYHDNMSNREILVNKHILFITTGVVPCKWYKRNGFYFVRWSYLYMFLSFLYFL